MSQIATGDRPAPGADEVYEVLIEALTGIVGPDYVEEMEVGPDSRFEADLELESMEIAELAEQMMQRYGSQVDFVGWFAEMELEQLIELSIGQVVGFVVASAGAAPPGAGDRPATSGASGVGTGARAAGAPPGAGS